MTPPQLHLYELNIDGSYLKNPEVGGIGGVIRNRKGDWILGFSKGFQLATNNQMELLSLLEGLKIVEDQKLFPIEINVDSVQVFLMLKMVTYTMILSLIHAGLC